MIKNSYPITAYVKAEDSRLLDFLKEQAALNNRSLSQQMLYCVRQYAESLGYDVKPEHVELSPDVAAAMQAILDLKDDAIRARFMTLISDAVKHGEESKTLKNKGLTSHVIELMGMSPANTLRC